MWLINIAIAVEPNRGVCTHHAPRLVRMADCGAHQSITHRSLPLSSAVAFHTITMWCAHGSSVFIHTPRLASWRVTFRDVTGSNTTRYIVPWASLLRENI